MNKLRMFFPVVLGALVVLGGCATRPVNPPIKEVDLNAGYTFQTRQKHFRSQENLVILAFSGGGTRAAAFSYGVLEYLRRTEAVAPNGTKFRLLDAVDVITGVSGGSFTALAYGLYGDKLFTDYEQRFLKRDVQGELLRRALNPGTGATVVDGLGPLRIGGQLLRRDPVQRSDLRRSRSRYWPFIMASATDISTGGRVVFNQNIFNLLCSDLNAVRCPARPRHRPRYRSCSTVTIDNHGAPATSRCHLGSRLPNPRTHRGPLRA
jgi:NTE family protein